MIKKLTFRGITRTPSERNSADGGCAESLNVQIESGDTMPMLQPIDITLSVTGQYSSDYKVEYVHKTGTYVNYIGSQPTAFGNSNLAYSTGSGWISFMEVSGSIRSISSVGNTLVIVTDSDTYYAKWTDGAYKNLGSTIPEPVVEFVPTPEGAHHFNVLLDDLDDAEALDMVKALYGSSESLFNSVVQSYYGTNGLVTIGGTNVEVSRAVDCVARLIWGAINSRVLYEHNEGRFTRPILARYALKMYDGTYAYASAPILLGAGLSESAFKASYCPNVVYPSPFVVLDDPLFQAWILGRYYADAKLMLSANGWDEIIAGVDIFISTDINLPPENAIVGTKLATTYVDEGNTFTDFKFKAERNLEDEYLGKGNFYLVESVPFNALGSAWSTYRLKPVRQDELVVKTAMPFDFRSSHNPRPISGALDYNSRIIGSGLRETLGRGYRFYHAARYGNGSPLSTPTYSFKFFIRTDENDVATVLAHWGRGDTINFPPGYGSSVIGIYGYLCYPDSRCFKVEVKNNSSGRAWTLPMKEHPNLDCAYWLSGNLTDTLQNILDRMSYSASFTATESRVIENGKMMIVSESSNPFIFPVDGRKSFNSNILAIATTTKALSTGQFGQFPLYVFTEDGIHSIAIANDGTFGNTTPLSRDVAIKGTVTPIEQAIVFTTKQGVMLLAGSDIRNISPNMNGKHYVMETDAAAMLADTAWADYVQSANEPFMEFMGAAKSVFDYVGHRLIFFNFSKSYGYVYALDSDTWHKFYFTDMLPSALINSYPDAFVTFQTGGQGASRIFNLSTFLDGSNSSQSVLPGIIATRNLDFDAPDIYKRINRIRLRGDYEKGHVKYMLLGSNDGTNFRVLSSLRGPSWKQFRIIVLSSLASNERLSYAEIDYDTAFADKIR